MYFTEGKVGLDPVKFNYTFMEENNNNNNNSLYF